MVMPVTQGYALLDPRPGAAGVPNEFTVPDEVDLASLSTGDRVKLMFEHIPPSKKWGVERMWVAVEMIDGNSLRGTLINRPFEPAAALHAGHIVEFERFHIVGVERAAAAISRLSDAPRKH